MIDNNQRYLLSNLNRMAHNGTENEKIVINYIFDNIDDIEELKASDIAINCYVSKSFISKFVKKFGYNNFYDFRHQLSIDVSTEEGIKENSNYNIDVNDVDKLSKIINENKRVFVYGEKFSKLLAVHMYYRLLTTGVDACLIEDILFERRRVPMDPDSVIIVLCKDEMSKSATLYIDLLSLSIENIHVITLQDQDFKNVKHIYKLDNHSISSGNYVVDTTIPINFFIEMVSAALTSEPITPYLKSTVLVNP